MRGMTRPLILTATFVLVIITWADAQSQTSNIRRVGIMQSTTADDAKRNMDAFRDGMRELGWIEGKNVVFEYRHADGDVTRLAGFAAELVRLQVDVIFTGGTQGTLAAKKATSSIPIIAGAAGDLVGTGLVESLARPGGNVTGSTVISPDLSGKRLELLKEVIPNAVRIAVLFYPGSRTDRDELKQIETVAQSQKLKVQTEKCATQTISNQHSPRSSGKTPERLS
jgi:putative ABC transport system substrate-binding protein